MNAMVSEIGSARAPWVSAGVNVFPCDPADKHPLVKWKDLTQDGWASVWRRRPDAMAGLDCGRHGIVVIDCDCKNGVDGEGNFRRLASATGVDLSAVPRVCTPSGGKHFYFAAPRGGAINNSAGRLALGVDVRGTGGYVIAPGSTNSARRGYIPDGFDLGHFVALVTAKQLPDLPAMLALRIASGTANDELSGGVLPRWSLAAACARIAAAGPGTRNSTLNQEAYIAGLRIGAGAVDEEAARKRLSAAATAAGLDDSEIERTIDNALARAAAADTGNAGGTPEDPGWERTAAGGIKVGIKNARLALVRLGVVPRRDVFADEIRLANAEGFEPLAIDHAGKLTDPALISLRGRVRTNFGFDPGKEHLFDAVAELAEDGRFNPVAEWLDRQTWDGTRRLASWLPRVTGVKFSPLYGYAGVALLLAMVARARYPGTKFDLCLVLEGAQGIGKSTLAKALCAGPGDTYHTDVPSLLAMLPKEKGETLAGKWVVELAELSGLTKSDVESVKAFLSQASDRYRSAYGRVAKDQPRTCVIVATTNAREYLMDRSGNRRFVPIPCTTIDVAGFIRDRDQLFAEADHMLRLLVNERGGSRVQPGRPLPDDMAAKIGLPKSVWNDAAAAVNQRLVADVVEEAIETLLDGRALPFETLPDGRRFVGTATILDALRARGVNANPKGLPDVLKRLGWEREQAGGKDARRRGFAKPPG